MRFCETFIVRFAHRMVQRVARVANIIFDIIFGLDISNIVRSKRKSLLII